MREGGREALWPGRAGAPGGRPGFPACPRPGCQMAGPLGLQGRPGGLLPFLVLQAGCKALWGPIGTRAENCTLGVVRDPINRPEVGGSWQAPGTVPVSSSGAVTSRGAAFHRRWPSAGGRAGGHGAKVDWPGPQGNGCGMPRGVRGPGARGSLLRPPARGFRFWSAHIRGATWVVPAFQGSGRHQAL